jgi:D-serine dehydratase
MNKEEFFNKIRAAEPFLFLNQNLKSFKTVQSELGLSQQDVVEAEERMLRFSTLLVKLFPELESANGIIESPLKELKNTIMPLAPACDSGRYWLKCDHDLPVSGSVKARGGFYEVLWYTEKLAYELGFLQLGDDYIKLGEEGIRQKFNEYTIEVGSTGNLGLSIGIMAQALGFRVRVHMSSDAKEWKKKRLRDLGVVVIEYESDYSAAVKAGRESAAKDPAVYFIDDENSLPLFLGYSFAGIRLNEQLEECGVQVDENHPLFVYLPCGVGGAPGGICFGLKLLFGDNVHCFFAEPVQAPGMTLAMLYRFKKFPSVYDFGMRINTAADGLAVGSASRLVGRYVQNILSGCYTVTDSSLFTKLYQLYQKENISIEPSAAAGFLGPEVLCGSEAGIRYLEEQGLLSKMQKANHVVWSTGGSLVPAEEFRDYYEQGRRFAREE